MPTGTVTTYDLQVGLYLDIESMISLLDPFDIPLQGGSGADGRSALSTGTCFEKKVEWLDETLLVARSTLVGAHTNVVTTLTVPAGDELRFQVGDVVLVGAEYMRVTATPSAGAVTVTRTYAGTNAAHAAGDAVVGVGMALPEGADAGTARAIDRNNRFNITQIFGPTPVQVSGSENAVKKYGTEGVGEFQHQVANRTKEMGVAIDQALVYGVRLEDTTNKWRTMGGIDYFTTALVDSTTTTISESSTLDMLQAAFNAGGRPDRLMVGTKQKRRISGWIANLTLQESLSTDVRGQTVDYFDSDFGRISILLNRWVRDNNAYGFARDQATVETLRPLVFEMLAKTGDSMKGQLVGEKTMRFRRAGQAFKFTALT